MALLRALADRVVGDHHEIVEEESVAYRRLDATAGRDAGDHDVADAVAAQIEVERRALEGIEAVLGHHHLLRQSGRRDVGVPVGAPRAFQAQAVEQAETVAVLGQRRAGHLLVVGRAHEHGEDVALARRRQQLVQPRRHGRHALVVGAGPPERAVGMAKIVLHVDHDQGRGRGIEQFAQRQLAAFFGNPHGFLSSRDGGRCWTSRSPARSGGRPPAARARRTACRSTGSRSAGRADRSRTAR